MQKYLVYVVSKARNSAAVERQKQRRWWRGQRHRKFPGQVPSPSAARRAGLSTMNYGIKCGVVKNGKILCCIK